MSLEGAFEGRDVTSASLDAAQADIEGQLSVTVRALTAEIGVDGATPRWAPYDQERAGALARRVRALITALRAQQPPSASDTRIDASSEFRARGPLLP